MRLTLAILTLAFALLTPPTARADQTDECLVGPKLPLTKPVSIRRITLFDAKNNGKPAIETFICIDSTRTDPLSASVGVFDTAGHLVFMLGNLAQAQRTNGATTSFTITSNVPTNDLDRSRLANRVLVEPVFGSGAAQETWASMETPGIIGLPAKKFGPIARGACLARPEATVPAVRDVTLITNIKGPRYAVTACAVGPETGGMLEANINFYVLADLRDIVAGSGGNGARGLHRVTGAPHGAAQMIYLPSVDFAPVRPGDAPEPYPLVLTNLHTNGCKDPTSPICSPVVRPSIIQAVVPISMRKTP